MLNNIVALCVRGQFVVFGQAYGGLLCKRNTNANHY